MTHKYSQNTHIKVNYIYYEQKRKKSLNDTSIYYKFTLLLTNMFVTSIFNNNYYCYYRLMKEKR